MRRIIALTAVALAALGLPSLAAAQGTILLAYEGPLSGPQASNGRDMLRGVRLAVREINLNGGLAGRKIRLIAGDDRADAATGVKVAKALAARRPSAVIGPYNSSVGVANLGIYTRAGVFPVQLTSTDDTTGFGATVQPKNSQISPAEVAWMTEHRARRVAILWDPSTYTKGMADRMAQSLRATGAAVKRIEIDPAATDFADDVAAALAWKPDTVYVSTYFPQGGAIARDLRAAGSTARCFMGLANQDPGFIAIAGATAAHRCTFSGSPTPAQFGNARSAAYVASYRALFGKEPGTWGIYTYDSVYLWANAVATARTTYAPAVAWGILHTTLLPGATGPITIDPATGNRPNVPVAILGVSTRGRWVLERIHT